MIPNNLHLAFTWLTLKNKELLTTDNKNLLVLNPGNYHAREDYWFTNSTIKVEQKTYSGLVLLNPKTVDKLPIILSSSNELSNPILLVFSKDYIEKIPKKLDVPILILTSIKSEIGSCGLYVLSANTQDEHFSSNNYQQVCTRLNKLITNVSFERLNIKSQKIYNKEEKLNDVDFEQIFFKQVFKSYGHNQFSTLFENIAKCFPYNQVIKILNDVCNEDNCLYIYTCWLGLTGYINKIPDNTFTNKQLIKIQDFWKKSGYTSINKNLKIRGVRPKGNISYRILSLLQLLINTRKNGILISFLQSFNQMIKYPDSSWANVKLVNSAISKHFNKIDSISFLNKNYIGKTRLSIIVVNSILPFFLMWAKQASAEELTKTLFKFYWTFIGEKGANSKVKLIEKRLNNPVFNSRFKNSIAYSQGLLQIYSEICIDYKKNCQNCTMQKWLDI